MEEKNVNEPLQEGQGGGFYKTCGNYVRVDSKEQILENFETEHGYQHRENQEYGIFKYGEEDAGFSKWREHIPSFNNIGVMLSEVGRIKEEINRVAAAGKLFSTIHGKFLRTGSVPLHFCVYAYHGR